MMIIRMIIGIMLALVLCITPVAAVSGTDFDIVFDNSCGSNTYKYYDIDNPYGKYIRLTTDHSSLSWSLVTFKPANIPDAPVMVVNTSFCDREIHLTTTVDEWEIKYYSSYWTHLRKPDPDYLKNAGVVNLKEYFRECISHGLWLELTWGKYISCSRETVFGIRYSIPEV